ncbi:MAG: hypothetical protein ABI769_02470 [Pseudomonadota bacterium]
MKKAHRTPIALLGLCLSMACHSQQKIEGTLNGMLTRYSEMLAHNCPKYVAAFTQAKAMGDIGGIVVTGQVHQTMCVCQPAKIRGLLKSLSAAKLSAPIKSENDFLDVARPGILEPCVGEQMRLMFEGETCDGFKSTDIQTGTAEAAYCGCMKKEVSDWSDAEAAAVFQQIGAYNTSFRTAKSNRTPRPKRTLLVDRYIGSLTRCGGGGEFKD